MLNKPKIKQIYSVNYVLNICATIIKQTMDNKIQQLLALG